ncbi:MAG: BamA/TamA family outer membrane protein, partial [Salinibacter sp.]
RAFSGQVGYDTRSGVTLEGGWRHRNFYGNGRTFSLNLTAETGYPENPPSFLPGFLTRSSSQEVRRRFRASVTLRQPYLFSNRLSASVAPFVQERLNPALPPNPDRPLNLNERQYGLNSTLVFDVLPYRTLSLQHSVSRTRQYLTAATGDSVRSEAPLTAEDDLFNKSTFTLNGTFGDADDFINPTKGLIVRPTVDLGGFFFESGVEFARLGADVSGYFPVSEYVELAGRLSLGALWPFGESRTHLTLPDAPTDRERRLNRIYQNRFSDYLFFAGGGSDVRGWASQLAGGKVLRQSTTLQQDYVYRPLGGRTKISLSLEARFPLPGLGSNWRTGAFVDGAYVTPGPLTLTPPATVPTVVTDAQGTPVTSDPSQLLIGTGAGLRYKTPFGFLRIDLAYKLTPDALDLRRATDVGNAVDTSTPKPVSRVKTRFLRRFRVHFGIGRSF